GSRAEPYRAQTQRPWHHLRQGGGREVEARELCRCDQVRRCPRRHSGRRAANEKGRPGMAATAIVRRIPGQTSRRAYRKHLDSVQVSGAQMANANMLEIAT